MKKILLIILVTANVGVFAATTSSTPVTFKNDPTVGSRQSGSNQIFGNQPITGTKGQKYNKDTKNRLNKSTVGSRQSGSNQIFGNQPITSTKGEKYNKDSKKQLNKATVGSRQSGSNQIFGDTIQSK